MNGVLSVSADHFRGYLAEWADENPEDAAFVTLDVPDTAEYYLTVVGNAGFGVKQDGELIALFNHTAESGTGEQLVEWAVEKKEVTYLRCFNTDLVGIYRDCGFAITERRSWDESKAPENWNYDEYGRPEAVKMEVFEACR